ncbi:MAG: hypothetical protein OEV55_02155 [candidate division Zixibacteria bacterium]|nr:hypothetical protein [candidate division Zixibacteria bacterium]
MNSDLLSCYNQLLQEYDRILSLTDKLLYSLKFDQSEVFINSLLEERSRSLHLIQKITHSISDFEPFNSRSTDVKTVSHLKSLHSKLEEKANLLQRKEKELEELVKGMD